MEVEKGAALRSYQALRDMGFISNLLNKNSEPLLNVSAESKNSDVSEFARRIGNHLFTKTNKHDSQTHKEIFEAYSKSILYAPLDSQCLAFAYGNRSAFLKHIKKYADSIKDIERAVSVTKNDCLMVKLLCRKVECMKLLGWEDYQNELDKVQLILEQNDYCKEKLSKNVERAKQEFEVCNSQESIKLKQDLSKYKAEDSVEVQFNEEMGAHLVAKRDIKPGEIIFVEQPFFLLHDSKKKYVTCHFCLKTAWSSIPCDYCANVLYCSENCKEAAWKKYHDMECNVYISSFLSQPNGPQAPFRMLVMVLKEFGGLSRLKSHICQGLVDVEIFEKSFQNFYSHMTFHNALNKDREDVIDACAFMCLLFLMELVKKNDLFADDLKIENFKDLETFQKSDMAVFTVSLLTKLSIACNFNKLRVIQQISTCPAFHEPRECLCSACASYKGYFYGIAANYLKHNCYPNAEYCFSEEHEYISYAVLPIKKNTQITVCHAFKNVWGTIERQRWLKKYNFVCKCLACTENWPSIIHNPILKTETDYHVASLALQMLESDKATLEMVSKSIIKLCEQFSAPCKLVIVSIEALSKIFTRIHETKDTSFIENC